MKAEIVTVRKSEQISSAWAGGTTTQLAIWPPEADYKLRNFKWRISTARVDLEESSFTSLPGIHRLIMILEGSVLLTHQGHHEARLEPFDQDSFEGEWNTLSRGRCVDFNLMTAAGCEGEIEAVTPQSARNDGISPLATAEAFYCLAPRVEATVCEGEETFETSLGRGDFLLLRRPSGCSAEMALKDPTGTGRVLGVRAVVRH